MIFEDRICLPPLNLIHRRPRLLNLLEQYTSTGKSFVTIEAPSGYGKSVLLADFAQTTDLPVCWCALQPSDREPIILLQLLAHSLAHRFYELDLTELLDLLEPVDVPRSIRQLSQRLTGFGPHLIIFDDYHQAAGPGITLFIRQLMEYFPKTSRFIVAGQNAIKQLARSPQVPVLSREMLAFTAEEVQALLLKRFGFQLDLVQAEAIQQATNGNGKQILLKGHIMHAQHWQKPPRQAPEIDPPFDQIIFKKRSLEQQMTGHQPGTIQLAAESLDRLIAAEAGDDLIAQALQNRGAAFGQIGHLAAALADTSQALEMFEELGDIFNVGCCHQEVGKVLAAQGKLQRAQHHFHQAIRIWESQGHTLELVNSLNSLGHTLIMLGHYADALQQFNRSFELARQQGAKQAAALALNGCGEAYLGLNSFDKAFLAYQRFSDLELNERSLEIRNRINLGECHYRQGNLFEAFELATQANILVGEAGLKFERGLATALQGKVYVAWGEYEASFGLFEEALSNLAGLNILEQIKVRLWWSYSLFLDLRALAAFKQLRTTLSLILTIDELRYGLSQTITETQALLYHFLGNHKTPSGMQNSLELLLQQLPTRPTSQERGLQFFTFGHPNLVVNGARKLFSQRGRGRKQPEVLAYLLFAGRDGGCRWDELSAAIWPELDPDSASTRFHQTIRRLRDGILGAPDYILVKNDYYQINPVYFQWCDVLVFEKLFDRISLLRPEEALDLQLEIIDLYQGEFLAGFDLEGWGRSYRTRCEFRFLRTVKMASDRLLQTGQPWKALVTAKQGLNQDYFREDLHRNVLTAYRQLGLRSELQHHYQQMQETFERELGEPPLPETKQLYQKLKAQV